MHLSAWASAKQLKPDVQWHLYIYTVTYHIRLWALIVERNLSQTNSVS